MPLPLPDDGLETVAPPSLPGGEMYRRPNAAPICPARSRVNTSHRAGG